MIEEFFDDLKDKFMKDERILELKQLSKEKNWGFRKQDHFANQSTALKGFKIFKGKKRKRLRGILIKPEESIKGNARIYDYIYYPDSGKKKTTVVEIETSQLNLSKFFIRSKRGFQKFKDLFAKRPIILPQVTHFHANYQIEAIDEPSTSFEFNEAFLDMIALKKGIRVEGEGKYLLVYRKHKQIPANELLEFYDFAMTLAESLIFDKSSEYV